MTETLSMLTAVLVDRYRIERELGQGGMATVYLAQDLRHGRKVAIKVLRPRSGKELFHWERAQLVAVALRLGPEIAVGAHRPLFQANLQSGGVLAQ